MRTLFCLALVALASPAVAADPAALKAELIQAEADFCARAGTEGIPAAFLANIAPEGVLLAAGYEKKGSAVVRQQYSENQAGIVLTWKPEIVDVSASGDLGYTTGPYKLQVPAKGGAAPTLYTGRYLTVWKRQPDHTWKFVIDGGTEDKPKA